MKIHEMLGIRALAKISTMKEAATLSERSIFSAKVTSWYKRLESWTTEKIAEYVGKHFFSSEADQGLTELCALIQAEEYFFERNIEQSKKGESRIGEIDKVIKALMTFKPLIQASEFDVLATVIKSKQEVLDNNLKLKSELSNLWQENFKGFSESYIESHPAVKSIWEETTDLLLVGDISNTDV